jgi:predicted PP-loop superfamily ATPase
VIDQAKYLDEVQEYWSDIDQSVLISGDNLSTNLAVVSEDRLAQLKAMANNRRAKDDIVVVSKLQNQA